MVCCLWPYYSCFFVVNEFILLYGLWLTQSNHMLLAAKCASHMFTPFGGKMSMSHTQIFWRQTLVGQEAGERTIKSCGIFAYILITVILEECGT